MKSVHYRAAALSVLMALVICSCARRGDSSFEKECDSFQSRVPSEARLVRTAAPRHSGYVTEASWEYEVAGNDGAAKEAFQRNVPRNYELVRENKTEVIYAKYDGHDSFHLALDFGPAEPHSTRVTVVLKSIPD